MSINLIYYFVSIRTKYTFIVGAIFLITSTGVAHAQTRFLPPDTTIDFSRYRTGGECYAVLKRLRVEYERGLNIWKDTMEKSPLEDSLPIASTIVESLKPCANQYLSDTLFPDRDEYWEDVLMAVHRVDDAVALRRRRIARSGGSDTVLWVGLQGILQMVSQARPKMGAKVDSVMSELGIVAARLGFTYTARTHVLRMRAAGYLRDTIRMDLAARRAIAFYDSLSENDRRALSTRIDIRDLTLKAHEILGRGELRDSLLKSDDAYRNMRDEIGKRGKSEIVNSEYRVAVPSVTGEFWFAQTSDTQKHIKPSTATPIDGAGSVYRTDSLLRPVRGKVNLIVSFDNCRSDTKNRKRNNNLREPVELDYIFNKMYGSCWDAFATLRRLAERYPDLEITILTATAGYIDPGSGILTPEEEANTLANWWFGFHHLPGVLAVSHTTFFRLESPDNRRVDLPVQVVRDFILNSEGMKVGGMTAGIIDTKGYGIVTKRLSRESEMELREVLDVVMARYRAGVSAK